MLRRHSLYIQIWLCIFLVLQCLKATNSHGHFTKPKVTQEKCSKNENISRETHSHEREHQVKAKEDLSFIGRYISHLTFSLSKMIEEFSKKEQAYTGALIISSAPIPIFCLMILFNITNIKILDIMSSFASGALLGDVILHNLPEIMEHHDPSKEGVIFFKKELLICWGVVLLFMVEKIFSLFSRSSKCNDEKNKEKHVNNNNDDNSNEHNHEHNVNIFISLLGDFLHNVTDGIAIGAAFSTNLKLGISLTCSIFFHEIPHEIGDFAYLLKQKMKNVNALTSQLFSACGSFIGVYLNFLIGDNYSIEILSFACGAFLYLSLNTILGDLKKPHSLINILLEVFSFISGVYVLYFVI